MPAWYDTGPARIGGRSAVARGYIGAMMPDGPGEHTEIEAKLVVRAARRREIVRTLQELDALGPYALVERPPRDLHDRYYDTPAGDLVRHGVAVRLRTADGETALTLKGPPEVLDDGGLARFELEDRYSIRTLATVVAKLRGWGIDLREVASDERTAPEIALEATGLRRIHQRTVRRVVRDAVADAPHRSAPVAEIVLDAVTFDVDGRRALHDEIEIEGRGPDAAAHVRAGCDAIRALFGDGVRSWQPSKLAIGTALDALESDGVLAALLDDDGRLTDDGYAAILDRLAAS